MHHDEVRDILANSMRTVLRDVEVEPHLLPLSGEVISPATANRDDEARSDIRAKGFWLNQQSEFFDIRIFYPHAQSYSSRSLLSLTSSIEKEKRRQYGSRVIEIEHGSFTPLVF
jgi:hypothetical protein